MEFLTTFPSRNRSKIETLIAMRAEQWARFVSNYDTKIDFEPTQLCLIEFKRSFRLTNGVKLTLHHVTMCSSKAFFSIS